LNFKIKTKMSISDLRLYVMNAGALGVSFMNQVEDWLKIILLLITIGYTLSKWVKLKSKNK
jgi:hypothetical protein|tara:strand:- start:145 stop:327 length:183 start_codon:yes stop_codon:yes gene_type:complete